MTTAYSNLLGLALPVTGELSGTWGDTVNDYITKYLDDAIANAQIISGSQTAVTLSKTTGSALVSAGSGATGSAQYALIRCTGNPASTLTITVSYSSLTNAQFSKTYLIFNSTSTNQSVVVQATTSSGTSTGVTITSGEKALIAWNGTDFVKIATQSGTGEFVTVDTTNLEVTNIKAKDGTAAATIADSTGAITVSTLLNVDNLRLDGNTLSSTDSNGNIVLAPNGTGDVQLDADTVRVGDSNVNVTITSNGTADLILNTNAGTNSGSITIQDGVDGNIVIAPNGNGQVQISNAALDLTTIEVTNIKAKDGTASMTLADSTGIITLSATAGTANGVAYLNGSRALTTGSALTFDGTKLGVGVATPAYLLDLGSNSDPTMRLYYGANGYFSTISATSGVGSLIITANAGAAAVASNMLFDNKGTGSHLWNINGSEQMRLTSTGLGIGTSSPGQKLEVTNAGAVSLRLRDTTTNWWDLQSASYLAFIRGSTEMMRLDPFGNLGIGTSSPAYRLDVSTALTGTAAGDNTAIALNSQASGRDANIRFGDSVNATARIGYLSGALYMYTNGAERMRLDTSGNLGIGTSSPSYKLDVFRGTTNGAVAQFTGNNASRGLKISTAQTSFADDTVVLDAQMATYGTLQLATGGTTRATLDSSGNLGLGVTPSAWGVGYKAFQNGVFCLASDGTNNDLTANRFINSGGTSTYIANGFASMLRQEVGTFKFYTAPSGTAGNAISFTQAMTLDASGRLLVKATSNTGTNTKLAVGSGLTSGNAVAYISTENVDIDGIGISNWTGSATTNRVSLGFDSSGHGAFRIGMPGGVNAFQIYDISAGAERARISSDGTFRVKGAGTAGTTDAVQFSGSAPASAMKLDALGRLLVGGTSNLDGAKVQSTTANTDWSYSSNQTGSGTFYHHVFRVNSGVAVGTITSDSSTTTYATSSDYRLKNITGPITTSGAYIDSLNPVEGTWKADGSTFVGLIAHEVQEASRTTVATGTKDGEEMQGMDYSNAELIANLIAEVKSLRARVAQLESKGA